MGKSIQHVKIQGFDRMIIFVGLGLSIDQLTLSSISTLLKCKKIYIDTYTSTWFPSFEELVEILNEFKIDVIKARREDLEGSKVMKIIEEASIHDVCIAVAGDPMIATTHSAIVIEAAKKDVEVGIIPSSSIFNVAISLSCLQIYRFGKPVTIVRPKNGIIFEYPLHVIKTNLSLNLHTLTLLEVDIEQNYFMTPKEAISILLNVQNKLKEKILDENDKIIVLKAIGSSESEVMIKTIREILEKNFDYTLYTLIIPAKYLHPVEEECINIVKKFKIKQIIDTTTLKNIINFMSNKHVSGDNYLKRNTNKSELQSS